MLPLLLTVTAAYALVAPAPLRARAVAVRRAATAAPATTCDVAVVGAGPAGSVLAWLLAERGGLDVALIDARQNAPWPNNYGVWEDEWQDLAAMMPELDLATCVADRWAKTDCYFGGSWDAPVDERTRLDRAYCRVDREKLRATLRARSRDAGVSAVEADVLVSPGGPRWCANVVDGVTHDAAGSTLATSAGDVRATVIVDATGFESRLTSRRGPDVGDAIPPPGYQVAYGFEALVRDLGPYDAGAMLLFDYRTDHLQDDEQRAPPTFMYAMPLGEQDGLKRVFFEETSLVARPAVTLAECERRAFLRLAHVGVEVVEVCSDEPPELCYIPMGGPRPDGGQRVVAYGGAAALVHPATGYQLCRGLAAAPAVAAAIAEALERRPGDADHAARRAYRGRVRRLALWF